MSVPSGLTTPPPAEATPPRKLYRSAEGRMLGGVARGLAGHLALPVSWVRVVMIALTMANGLGVLVYAAFWFLVPLGTGGVQPPGRDRADRSQKRDRGQLLAMVILLVGTGVFVDDLRTGYPRIYLWPLLLIAAGVALVWRQADDARRAHWADVTRRKGLLPLARNSAGVVLVCAGVVAIIFIQGNFAQLGSVLTAAVAILVGVALLVGPYLVTMVQDLSEERLMRIRAQERAEVAAHVHDSVLHTLTLIQRNADDPGQVRRLARAQERELRVWLYKPEGTGKDEEDEEPDTLAEAVRVTAAEVEDHHGVPVEVVCVGDCPLDERLTAQVQAAREAMVNAAKYGGEGGTVQVFAEVEGRTVFVSVRDRGPGFDLDAVPEDRMGVRESIIGRMRRNGGTARLRSAPDGGTEVELEMERAEA
ncbi:PspC domain-containing protein [Streptomyces sp. NPDC005438]|uniref:ATP-binding protein n=1 Tax=Streptomyces sp. NPDC005438 TaxID=3156880 RepID=UPI0033BCBB30